MLVLFVAVAAYVLFCLFISEFVLTVWEQAKPHQMSSKVPQILRQRVLAWGDLGFVVGTLASITY
eukprot:6482215-Amphidinium_carterae.2